MVALDLGHLLTSHKLVVSLISTVVVVRLLVVHTLILALEVMLWHIIVVRFVLKLSLSVSKRAFASIGTVSLLEIFAELGLVVASALCVVELLSVVLVHHLALETVVVIELVLLTSLVLARHVRVHAHVVHWVHLVAHAEIVPWTWVSVLTATTLEVSASAATDHHRAASVVHAIHRLNHTLVIDWRVRFIPLLRLESLVKILNHRLRILTCRLIEHLVVLIADVVASSSLAASSCVVVVRVWGAHTVTRGRETKFSITMCKVAFVSHKALAIVIKVAALCCFVL